MIAVMKREFDSMRHTMTAPIFCAVLIALSGIYFIAYNLNAGYPYFSYTLQNILFILMIIVPLLTMRSFSEERRQKTDQLLLTSPLRLGDIVLGKYLAMLGVLLLCALVLALCPLIIKSTGTAYLLVDYSTLFAFCVVGGFFISVGMFVSSRTESQVIAAVCTVAALIVLYLWEGIVSLLPESAGGALAVLLISAVIICAAYYSSARSWLAAGGLFLVLFAALLAIYFLKPEWLAGFFSDYLSGFAVTAIITNFAQNHTFDVLGIIKLLLATGVMLFLSSQSLEKRRWS